MTHPSLTLAAQTDLERILPKGSLITGEEGLRPYECDGFTASRALPLAVALVSNEAEIIEVLRCCRKHKLPVVPRGAGTSLSGGAQPHPLGLVLSCARMNRILHIDAQQRLAVVEPGVTNLAVSAATRPLGLFYAPDPSSQLACTVGGNVAENAGGVRCMKYGLTVHNVLALRGITSDGEIIETGETDGAGLDFLALLHGSEGMLAVVTRITLRLHPVPSAAQVVVAGFASVGEAANAVAALVAAGITPSGLEMMDQGATQAVEPFVNAGYDLKAEAILLCESDGSPIHVETEMTRIREVLSGFSATLKFSQNEEDRLRLWAGRKAAFPAAGRISPDYYCMDSTIPRRHLGQLLLSIQAMSKKYNLRCINVFHAGDGNMHPLILYDAQKEEELARAEAFGGEILEESLRLGGTITGEHGVGVEKLDQMCVQFNADELSVFHDLKRIFDDSGILNPDKGIPLLRRCAELGRQHVHQDQVSHPLLPRF